MKLTFSDLPHEIVLKITQQFFAFPRDKYRFRDKIKDRGYFSDNKNRNGYYVKTEERLFICSRIPVKFVDWFGRFINHNVSSGKIHQIFRSICYKLF